MRKLASARGLACALVGAIGLAVTPPARGADAAASKDAAPEARGASFDCAKASTRIEKLSCSDGEASDLDGQLARVYRATLAGAGDADSLKAEQRAWLTGQRNKCADVACVRDEYKKRLAALA